MRLILARHAQTEHNRELRYQGHLGTSLSALGRLQARQLAASMADHDIEAVYSSDLLRCMETANAVGNALSLPVTASSQLREASYGEWEGQSFAAVEAAGPGMVRARMANPIDFTPPGGESLGDTLQRVESYLLEISANHDAKATVFVLSHRGPIRMLLSKWMSIPFERALTLRVDNCAYSVIDGYPGNISLAHYNVTAEPALVKRGETVAASATSEQSE